MRTKREAHPEQHSTVEVVDGPTFCDGCHQDIADTRGAGYSEITIKAVLGDSFPPNFPRSISQVDCCKQCFLTRVYPALIAAGFAFRMHEEGVDGRVWESTAAGIPPLPPPIF